MNNLSKDSKKVDFIIDITENEFAEKVIENSAEKIVLVDFWAPWCEPCKKLTPVLENIAKELEGFLMLAKINIDENQQLASQLKIQSIPTVIGCFKKQLVNGFQGVLPKSKIIEFIEKIYGSPLPKNKEDQYKSFVELVEQNDLENAKNLIENYLSENSSDTKVVALYIKCLCELKNFKEVKDFIESLSETVLANEEIKKQIENFEMLKTLSKSPSIEELLKKYNKEPTNVDNILNLSEKFFYEKKTNEALELLVKNYIIFKNNDKEKIKKTLLKFFDLLGNNNEHTKIYRRKLSSLLFS